jgi:hypothetical protein
MTKEVSAVGGGKGIQRLRGGALQPGEGALGALAQKGFEFGKSQFDRVEIWAVSREVEQLGTAIFQGLANAADLVGREVVANDKVAAAQFRGEDFLDVGQKHGALHGAIEQQGGGEAIMAQGGDEGGRAPVAMGHMAQATRGGVGPPIEPGHLGVEAGFIEENELVDGPTGLPALPLLASQGDVRPILLRGAQRFFYSSSRGAQDDATRQ